MVIGLALGWTAWLMIAADRPTPAIAMTVMAIVVGATGATIAITAVFGVFFLRKAQPLELSPNSRRLLLALSAVLALGTLAGAYVVHSKIPVGGMEGVAGVTPDGRFAVINHGQVVRYVDEREYRQLEASSVAGTATVANAVLTAFLVTIALRLRHMQRT